LGEVRVPVMVLDPVGAARQLTGGFVRWFCSRAPAGHIGDMLVRAFLARGEKVRCLLLRGDDVRPMKDGGPSRGRAERGRASSTPACCSPFWPAGPFPPARCLRFPRWGSGCGHASGGAGTRGRDTKP